jgi:hypothetical protein
MFGTNTFEEGKIPEGNPFLIGGGQFPTESRHYAVRVNARSARFQKKLEAALSWLANAGATTFKGAMHPG